MSDSRTPLCSVLVSEEASLGHALTYLYSVVFKDRFDIVETIRDARQQLNKLAAKDVVFVHAPDASVSALSLVKELKSSEGNPVVIGIQPSQSEFGARAFLAGADDVVDWPRSLHELALRVNLRLGRSLRGSEFPHNNRNWEAEAYIAERAGLTTSEAQVMRVLFAHDGEIVSRDDLSYAVDARPWRYGDRKFDVHVGKIRKKLTDAFGSGVSVSTIRSVGYRFSAADPGIFFEK